MSVDRVSTLRRQPTEVLEENYNVLDHITGDGVFEGTPYDARPENPLYPAHDIAHKNFQLENFKKQREKLMQQRAALYEKAHFDKECEHAENSWREAGVVYGKLPPMDQRKVTPKLIEETMCLDAIEHYEQQWARFEEEISCKIDDDEIGGRSITFRSIPWPFFRAVWKPIRRSTIGFQPSNFPVDPQTATDELEAFIFHETRIKKYMDKETILNAERERWSPTTVYPELMRRVVHTDVELVSAAFIFIVALLEVEDEFNLDGYSLALEYYIGLWYEDQKEREDGCMNV